MGLFFMGLFFPTVDLMSRTEYSVVGVAKALSLRGPRLQHPIMNRIVGGGGGGGGLHDRYRYRYIDIDLLWKG